MSNHVLSRVLLIAILLMALPLFGAAAQTAEPAPPPLRALDFAPFEAVLGEFGADRVAELDALVPEATFAELQSAMAGGDLTSLELTTYYLSRIRDIDVGGLQSMLEFNPDALTIAADLDAERDAGTVRGPLHGIPISIKDNIGSGDQMHNTAGAAVLADVRSDRDSFVVAALREAGVVIIGKANMSEWAYWMNTGPSGYTALGGQVLNPYDPAFDPLGSSTGSAVGTSANLVAASIGTETLGSLIAPASVNGVVGMYPSRGLVSRDRVIPVTDQTDTPGPIARTVADVAILLTAIAGVDAEDETTNEAAALAGTDFTELLDAEALKGKRVGIFTGAAAPLEGMALEDFYGIIGIGPAIAGLETAGAEVVPIWDAGLDNTALFVVLGNNGLRLGFADYIAAVDPEGPISSIADVVAFNAQDPQRYAFYGQERLEDAAASDGTLEQYVELGAQLRDQARAHRGLAGAERDRCHRGAGEQVLEHLRRGWPSVGHRSGRPSADRRSDRVDLHRPLSGGCPGVGVRLCLRAGVTATSGAAGSRRRMSSHTHTTWPGVHDGSG
ncbi:MAG: amidase family protein [Chloroflexota bacterium]